MQPDSANAQEQFYASLKSAPADEEKMADMLEEARQMLVSEYQEALMAHEAKLASLKKLERAAEQRIAEVEALAGQPQTLGEPLEDLPLGKQVEIALAGLELSPPLPLEPRLRQGLPLLSLFDKVDRTEAGTDYEELTLAQLLDDLASGLAKLNIFEFAMTPAAFLDQQMLANVCGDGNVPEQGHVVQETLRNGFCLVDDDGRSVCLRKAVVRSAPVLRTSEINA